MSRSTTPKKSQTVTVDGHRIKLTNLDKVMYPASGTTKRDVLDYYRAAADSLIKHATGRPVTRKRWVNGVGTKSDPGNVFFQKNLDDSTPSWVVRRRIKHKDHTNEYPLAGDEATLVWLAQIAALELHVPQWQFGKNGRPKHPDRLVLDLDPGEGAGLAECAEVALQARSILADMGLAPVPVTSGSKGMHIYAALNGRQTCDQVEKVAHELARALEADHPDLVVSEMKKAARKGKVFVDWSQNNFAKTTVCPYSLRGKAKPFVAAPRRWEEIETAGLEQLEYRQVLSRLETDGDLFASSSEEPDRLATYRSMRDAAKTSEPVPTGKPNSSTGNSFVIHEHHARQLHWDFRLERDGVLASWALPKGVPTDPSANHLAVQTEDHPLEYGSFEGSIPKGEYGAGEVRIWDDGHYKAEKWKDGEEIVVTLHGRRRGGLGGELKFSLIHTEHGGKDSEKNWLIHAMKDDKKGDKSDRSPNPRSYSPMLATLGSEDSLDKERDWAFEMKWDGIRALFVVSDDGTALMSRRGHDMSTTYPELIEAVDQCKSSHAVIDGEIVALTDGHPDFRTLQQRMNLTKKADVERARRRVPVKFMAFDVLVADGEELVDSPYTQRRKRLNALVKSRRNGVIQVPPEFGGDLRAALAESRRLQLEGVMAKTRDGEYDPGARSGEWIKIKHHKTQEVVIIGWRPGKGSRQDTLGSLLVGVHCDGELRYAGRVGTGFDERTLRELRQDLDRIARKTPPVSDVPRSDARDAQWVSPKRVGEVEFAEWTTAGRLRQPSWRGYRPDKSAQDVVKES
ncbi:ATP-dependent DNA ligase [Spelaeicoccus albus]|uniref:DNA ligase (ATP) n=1 Tax=Spelaeicoccus albus TaxID=1280376 RepID=A0A7Z0D4J9_9MICO|nr:ATP-dependent DNA ligase [Spelaeicoccus albus]NYI68745.1 bifunctional non-homologous end joining protein LigD [Spelaeicoccus albus]